jgi:hypothetical protein
MTPKFPNITVKLSGRDGNAFAIIGAVTKALRANGVESKDVKQFTDDAMSGDYNHLLQVAMKTVNVE